MRIENKNWIGHLILLIVEIKNYVDLFSIIARIISFYICVKTMPVNIIIMITIDENNIQIDVFY